ncbi:LexA family protein [Microbulbifer sp. DLAB2-AA]|uniref:LexA family protein n=1 Tax=Microbulbifer sp. DLAB2-AA TaxID=3243394 RepID=UPI00403A3D67
MKHPDFAKRFKQAVTHAGVEDTQEALARLFDVSTVTIWSYRNGEKLPRMSTATRIAETLGVSVDWLLTGAGKGPGLLGNTEGSNVTQGPRIQGRIPLISWVQAGAFCEAVDLLESGEAEAWLPCPAAHSDRAYALRVNGDSMTSPYPGQRSYPEGTIIFVDPDKPLTNGCRVIAKINGEATFKTYAEDMGHIYLRPINPTYSPMDVTGKDITFCGVIIGSYTPE